MTALDARLQSRISEDELDILLMAYSDGLIRAITFKTILLRAPLGMLCPGLHPSRSFPILKSLLARAYRLYGFLKK
ncbi:hypothetical protein IEQ34_018161 [Dendrobium chrysotoxum]|uniref:Uncharacterized protein n=1 Tax=Dendrobium chrysotoxum TaxID=161865 RepID=A0AAV7GCI9_DENCH|nr:hypothetical protein IEQ34_018161 [Dendrobium chrysotoxum]